jgi:hypothetical protein
MPGADEKAVPTPMNFFKSSPSPDHPDLAPPKTREEAAQRTVDAYRDDLDKIADPAQRAHAEAKLRGHAIKAFGVVDRYVDKVHANQTKWEKTLNGLSEKNPVRAAGELAYGALQRRQHGKIGSMVLKEGRQPADILARAQKASASYKQKAAKAQPVKDHDRER